MEKIINEMEFAELEHAGGQHKFAERPNVCRFCHTQKKWHEARQDREITNNLAGEFE